MSLDPDHPLRSLVTEARPPSRLKIRLARTLRARSLLAAPRRRWAATVAAAALVVAAAVLLPRFTARADGAAYLLLLYEDEGFVPDRPEPELVAEYSAWAADLAREGALLMGEQLTPTSLVLHGVAERGGLVVEPTSPRSEFGAIAGLFVIRAADQAGALAIAGTCPHLRYGGRVVVRPVAG